MKYIKTFENSKDPKMSDINGHLKMIISATKVIKTHLQKTLDKIFKEDGHSYGINNPSLFKYNGSEISIDMEDDIKQDVLHSGVLEASIGEDENILTHCYIAFKISYINENGERHFKNNGDLIKLLRTHTELLIELDRYGYKISHVGLNSFQLASDVKISYDTKKIFAMNKKALKKMNT
jgi:hypothetical protein